MADFDEHFVRCASLLHSPGTQPALRAEADAWLAAFRSDTAAWSVCLGVLRAATASPEVRLQAAALLAWKAKRQLAQLQPVERQVELAGALTELVAAQAQGGGAGADDAALRGMCVALANLAIHCTGWQQPLEALGSRLPSQCMLEFLTLLGQECGDAAAAALSAPGELGWALRQRTQDWGPGVAAGLHMLHTASCGGDGGTLDLSQPQQSQLTLAVLRCFGAWVRAGCLQHVDSHTAAYFASLAGQLLFAADSDRGLPYSPQHLPTAVDVTSEIIEHATDALQPLLLQLAAALPARVAALHAGSAAEAAGDVSHLYGLYVSTHTSLCAASGPQGAALRQGLLQLAALPVQAGCEEGGPALPALSALSDLLECMAASQQRAGGGDGECDRPASPQECAAFAASALQVLLVQVAPRGSPDAAALMPGSGASEPHPLRAESAPLVHMLAELMGEDELVAALVAHAERAAAQHGGLSVLAASALDACLHLLPGLAALLEVQLACCEDRGEAAAAATGAAPLPAWLQGVLRLYGLARQLHGSFTAGAATPLPLPRPPTTLLHLDLLASFSALAPLATPLLAPAHQQQHAELAQLVLEAALAALRGCSEGEGGGAGAGDGDTAQLAAEALRMLCSSAAASGLPTSPPLLSGLEQGMAALQDRWVTQRYQQHQEAHAQLVTALVHALHAIPAHNRQLRGQAEAAVQGRLLEPLTAAAASAGAAASATATAPALGSQQQLRSALWHLAAWLHQLQALLNALESYSWHDGECGGAGGDGVLRGREAGRGVSRAAVGTLLACWPRLEQVCRWQGGGQQQPQQAAAQAEVHAELAACLCSTLDLDPAAFQPTLPAFADTVTACCSQPGATALLRPVMKAVEAYGQLPQYQVPLLRLSRSVLSAPHAQQLAALRGGDADPSAAQALLALLTCCLRQGCQWRQVVPGAEQELQALLRVGLPLAAANAASHHRGVAHSAVGALATLLSLALAPHSPGGLGPVLLGFAQGQGALLLQGLLLALLSLSSASHLPKVASLTSDMALLATSLAIQQQQQQQGGSPAPGTSAAAAAPEAVCVASGAVLSGWLCGAGEGVVCSGAMSRATVASLLELWDWQPVLQLAAQQLTGAQGEQGQGPGGGTSSTSTSPSAAQVRRSVQRSVRLMAEELRRGGQHSALAAAAGA
ncbi:hypothetical protein D9Q98_001588 [Chlorella vulgaris]|uniref:Uncharacterized protein n=1 Tax=Chlorella vulgaris TaxID=3077 RepID=A0A9D4TUU3_CHLVU|nr:hypothetical protein D9Q98_001588 [Chlorella vulgaris]